MKHNNPRLASLSRRLNPLWWLISRLLRLKPRPACAAVPKSILLVEVNLLGDMVMLIPLLRAMRRVHPEAHIALMAGPWGREILGDTGLVDEFITLRAPWVVKRQGVRGVLALLKAIRISRTRSWDWGIDVRGDVRNALLLSLARATRRIGYDFTGGASLLTDVLPDDGVLRHIIEHHAAMADYLVMPMTEEEQTPILLFNVKPPPEPAAPETAAPETAAPEAPRARRRVGFHFGASLALRRMPAEEARQLILSFQDREDADLILADPPDVRALNDTVMEKLPASYAASIERWQGSLKEFIGFLKTLDDFYSMDSGPAHLAAALGVRTTVFFGPHLSRAVRPIGPNVIVVEREDVACRPCDQHRCTNAIYQQCLTQIVALQSRR